MRAGSRLLFIWAFIPSWLLAPAFTAAAEVSQTTLQAELLDDLMHWAVKLSGLPGVPSAPTIYPLDAEQLVQKVCPHDPVNCKSLVSFYSTEDRTIFYLNSLDMYDDMDLSFLVHEMVHHLQYAVQGEALFATCERTSVAELQAYTVQNQYLTHFKQWRRFGDALRYIKCANLDASRSEAGAPPSDQLEQHRQVRERLLATGVSWICSDARIPPWVLGPEDALPEANAFAQLDCARDGTSTPAAIPSN